MTTPWFCLRSVGTVALILTTGACSAERPGEHDKEMPAGTAFCGLEDGLEFTTAGSVWSNLNVSASFMPDGSPTSGQQSSLFAKLDALAPRAVWQKEYARALATWSAATPLNVRIVSDTGAATGVSGPAQADARFGDIRLGARVDGSYAAYTYYPTTSTTTGGDSFLGANVAFNIGGDMDLYSVVLHELGHALGLGHSTYGTVMGSWLTGVYTGLKPDDVNGIQSRYGARVADAYDVAAANDTVASASPVSVAATGTTFLTGDITTAADVDHYSIVIPSGTAPYLSVSALAGESLLTPTLRLYDGNGAQIEEVSAANYGAGALIQFGAVAEGETYVLAVDSPVNDYFGVGAYRLAVQFRASEDGIPFAPSANLAADSRETNDSFAVATSLGSTANLTVPNLSIHWAKDQDYFTFTTSNQAKNYEVSLTYGAGSKPLEIEIFNSSNTEIAQSNGAIKVSFPVTRSTAYKVRVFSPLQDPRGYTLKVVKVN